MNREADFGGILGETFALAGDAARFIGIYVLIIGGLGSLGVSLGFIESTNQIAGFSGGVIVGRDTSLISALYQFGFTVLSIIAAYFLLAKLLETRGRLGEGGTRVWAYVGLTLLSAIGIIIGFVLVIIPGIILLVRWSASSGYLIGGKKGIVESLSASWDATSGHSWAIFFAGLVLIILLVLFGGVIGGVAGVAGGMQTVGVVSSIAEAVGNAMSLCFGIAVYTLVQTDDQDIGQIFE